MNETSRNSVDHISKTLRDAHRQVASFYDCRLVLAVQIAQTSEFLACLRQTGAISAGEFESYLKLFNDYARTDVPNPPKIQAIDDVSGVKQ